MPGKTQKNPFRHFTLSRGSSRLATLCRFQRCVASLFFFKLLEREGIKRNALFVCEFPLPCCTAPPGLRIRFFRHLHPFFFPFDFPLIFVLSLLIRWAPCFLLFFSLSLGSVLLTPLSVPCDTSPQSSGFGSIIGSLFAQRAQSVKRPASWTTRLLLVRRLSDQFVQPSTVDRASMARHCSPNCNFPIS